MPSSVAATTHATDRPLPFRARRDLEILKTEYAGTEYYVVKDPVALRYYRLRREQHRVLQLLDGVTSTNAIRSALQREFPAFHVQTRDVQFLVSDLCQKGLAESTRAGQGTLLLEKARKRRSARIRAAARSFLFLRLPGWDPEPVLQRIYPTVRWMFRPFSIGASILLIVAALAFLAVHFGQFQARLPAFHQFFQWPNVVWLWVSLALAKIVHEFGHGLTCRHFGGECHEMGLMLLVFSPCLYCDVSDSWMLRSKWKRIAIAGAGMYVEVVLSSLAFFAWWFSNPGVFNHLCMNLFLVSTVSTVIFNLNPLMRFDGYYMASDWLEIPNLREKADKALTDMVSSVCLGVEPQRDAFAPTQRHGLFALFAIASWCYRWLVAIGITVFLYKALEPVGLQSIGATLAIVTITSMVMGVVMKCVRIVRAARRQGTSGLRMRISTACVVAALLFACCVPLPSSVEAPFLIEPENVQHVFVVTGGTLEEMRVRPGMRVRKGQILGRIANPELEEKKRVLEAEVAKEETRVKTLRWRKEHGKLAQAEERLFDLRERLRIHRERLKRLTIRANVAGVVIEPVATPDADREQELQQWAGTPLEKRNTGALLGEKTHLLSIAPSDSYRAIVFVDQDDRDDLTTARSVLLRCRHIPDKLYNGRIVRVDRRHSEEIPPTLSNKYGGELATVTQSDGAEELTSVAYRAEIAFEGDPRLMRTGIRGRARFDVADRTALAWFMRWARRTFRFDL